MSHNPGCPVEVRLDEIGPWSEVKLDIVREYAQQYSVILAAQKNPELYHVYIDAFAGAGVHSVKHTGTFVAGSPLNALLVKPPFREYFFIDLHPAKVGSLRDIVAGRANVHVYEGDCNTILPDQVFPHVQYADYRRGLCLLDPYGLDLRWEVVRKAGEMKSLEVFLNFPVLAMNRSVLRRDPQRVADVQPEQLERMNLFWGDASWCKIAYRRSRQLGLFDDEAREKATVSELVDAYQDRLRTIAGFAYVPTPMPMRNSRGVLLYYLFFASHKPVAEMIVQYIFRTHGGPAPVRR